MADPAAILDVLDDGILHIDAGWRVRYANEAAVALVRRPRSGLLGEDVWSLFPRLAGTGFAPVLRRAMASSTRARMTFDVPDRARGFSVAVHPRDGGLTLVFQEVTDASAREQRHREAADLEARLRRVAVAVAEGVEGDRVFDLIVQEVVTLADCQLSELFRYEEDDRFTVLAATGSHVIFGAGDSRTLTPGGTVARQRESRVPQVFEDLREQPGLTPRRVETGLLSLVLVPIVVEGRVWGSLSVSRDTVWPDAADFARRLKDFAELAALAVAGAEAKAALARRAMTDGLTSLFNSEALRARVRSEVARVARHGGHVCLASLDLDDFKQLNDRFGHEVGDAALKHVAAALREGARAEDMAARVGGDEFALLIVDSDRFEALTVVERIRLAVGHDAEAGVRVSAGISEWEPGLDADALFKRADDALYWAKSSGRDSVWIYDPEVVAGLGEEARLELVRRNQALAGLRALARASDAKDPTTREHSDRVADLAHRLALATGWPPARAALVREAGILHDVGKVGVPDAILLKPGPLTAEEYEQVKQHAALGADIVGDVLIPEQVTWIRSHHERLDGHGYPDGLTADDIPEGAAILAVADSWDAMTGARPYGRPLDPDAALAECRRVSGTQLRGDLVEQLATLVGRALEAGIVPRRPGA